MVDYTIAAIPTMYGGRRYRSRLEARWAAFFDLLGWTHEYEPFDFGKWSPDFLVSNGGEGELLVEIKPITEFDQDVANKMWNAWDGAGSRMLLQAYVAPRIERDTVTLGSWIQPQEHPAWVEAWVGWYIEHDRPGFYADITDIWRGVGKFSSGWASVMRGDATYKEEPSAVLPQSYAEYTMELWARATNAVQWEPR